MKNRIIEEDITFILSAGMPWETMEGKNILITGANGFIPAYMVETLLKLNDTSFKSSLKVFGLVRNGARAAERFANYKGRRDLAFIVQDVCEPLKIKEDIHFIIHAASQASPKYYGKDPVGTISANVIGTYNLLKLAHEKKAEGFMFLSSGEVYGEVPENEMPIKESAFGYIDPMRVRSCYAEGKRAGETLCISWYHQYGVPVKIVRPFHTYGPGMRLDDGRVFADFVADIVNNRNIVMKSDGKATRTFCYLADSTVGFFTVLLNGRKGEVYNVGEEREVSIIDLANILAGLFPEKKLRVEAKETIKQEGYLRSTIMRHVPDTSKAKTLGWSPKYTLEHGFKRTIRSFSDT